MTAIPSQGTIAPGAVVTVSLSGKTTAPDIIVQFAAGTGGGGGVVKFGCQPGTGK